MRLIVACGQCQRQYDATGREPGSRFRCHCGAVITVEEPKGHEAAVVRCSSCGAPRQEGGLNCEFCGADFTLHERDLDTVCPKCLARVSHRANYCHHCATALVPEQLAPGETDVACPVCGAERCLTDRRIGDVAVLECDRCAGLWLGSEPFKQLVQRASSDALQIDRLLASKGSPPGKSGGPDAQAGQRWRYRNCVVCGKKMHRRNYGRRSGVIIDICRDHGIWFDADELPRILAWIRSGKQAEVEKQRAEQAAREERIQRRIAEASDRGPLMGGPVRSYRRYPAESPLGGFLDEIIEGLFGLG